MASKVDIANMALLKLGQPAIMSLDDNSHAAKLATQEFNAALEAILRAYPWPFAVKRVELARELNKPPFGFGYYYRIPADSVRIIDVFTNSFQYQIEGMLIATSSEKVAIRYVSKDTPIEYMDSLTVDVLALALAARLAITLTENPELQAGLLQQYDMQLASARSVWAVEDHPQTPIEGYWLKAHEHGMRTKADTFNPWGPYGVGVSGGEPSGPGVIPHG